MNFMINVMVKVDDDYIAYKAFSKVDSVLSMSEHIGVNNGELSLKIWSWPLIWPLILKLS